MDFDQKAVFTYEHLTNICSARNEKIISNEYPEVQDFIKKNEILVSRIALILGTMKPENLADESIRDLLGDTFDSLFSAKELIYKGYLGTPFTLLRRAWETISLMTYFILHPEKAKDWRDGKEIPQREIRKAHEKHPQGGDANHQKEAHAYFAKCAHPNSMLIPYRLLGSGSEYTMGNFAKPNDLITMANMIRLVQLWGYLRHVIVTRYGSEMYKKDAKLKSALKEISDEKGTKINLRLKTKHEEMVRKYKSEGRFK